MSRARPSRSMRMFFGLTSRCRTPWRCAAASADATSLPMRVTSSGGSGPTRRNTGRRCKQDAERGRSDPSGQVRDTVRRGAREDRRRTRAWGCPSSWRRSRTARVPGCPARSPSSIGTGRRRRRRPRHHHDPALERSGIVPRIATLPRGSRCRSRTRRTLALELARRRGRNARPLLVHCLERFLGVLVEVVGDRIHLEERLQMLLGQARLAE